MLGGVDMGSSQGIVVRRSKSRDRFDLDSNDKDDLDSLPGDRGQQAVDDWLDAPTPSQPTNSGTMNAPRGWDVKDSDSFLQRRNSSGFDADQNASRLGSQTGSEREFDRGNALDGDRNGRDYSSDKDVSIWARVPNRDLTGSDRFEGSKFSTFKNAWGGKDEAVTFGYAVQEPGKTGAGLAVASATDPAHTDPAHVDPLSDMAPPSGFGNFTPLDDIQRRRSGELAGYQIGASQALEAWEKAPSISRSPSLNNFKTGQNIPSRVVAPNRPVTLPFPKRPDSPY